MSLEDTLDAAASALATHEQEVQRLAATVRVGGVSSWEGSAAQVFRERCAARATALSDVAELLTAAASAARSAADEVRDAGAGAHEVRIP